MTYNEKAAKWWADKLSDINAGHFCNGDDSREGGFVCLMYTVEALSNQPSEEKISEFESRLANIIKERVEESGSLILETEYGPLGILCDVSDELKISPSVFPWKTTMNIIKNKVTAKMGCDKEFSVIFQEESKK